MLDTNILRTSVLPEGERLEVISTLIRGEAEQLFGQGYRTAEATEAIQSLLQHVPIHGIDIQDIIGGAWDGYVRRHHGDMLRSMSTARHADDLFQTVRRYGDEAVFEFGIRSLDSAFGGIYPGEIGILVGSPGSMKTSLALCGAERHLGEGGRVLFLSLDMAPEAIIERRLQARLKCPGWIVRDMIRRNDAELCDSMEKMKREDEGSFYLIGSDKAHVGVKEMLDLTGTIRPSLVVIDYLTLLRENGQSDLEGVNRAMPVIKKAAQQLKIAFLLLSQMGRASRTEQGSGKTGGHSKGGGIVEELAHSEIELLQDAPEMEGEPPRLIATITKTRRGVRGQSFQLSYDGPSMTFTGQALRVRKEKPTKPLFSTSGQTGPA